MGGVFDLAGRQERLKKLDEVAADPAIWEDQERAQKVLRERSNFDGLCRAFSTSASRALHARCSELLEYDEPTEETLSELASENSWGS